MEALVYLLVSSGPASVLTDLGRDLAHIGENVEDAACNQRGRKIVERLVDHGLVSRPRSGEYTITEKGRIAAALVMFREPGLKMAFFDD